MTEEQEEFGRLWSRVKAEFNAMSDAEFAALFTNYSNQEVPMSNTALATKPASILRTYTQQVRDHTAAMQRLQDQYFAALKRAEAAYFDGVKRITDTLTQTEPDGDTQPESPAPQQ